MSLPHWYCRLFQRVMYVGTFLLPWREPTILHTNTEVIDLLDRENIVSLLIVTDPQIAALGLPATLEQALDDAHITYAVYDRTVANPTIANVEEALALAKRQHAQAVIGFGGGSSMDCAKGVAARIARPHKSVLAMKGLFKIRKHTMLTLAIPTTSGTGSEATVAAVITDPETHHKYPINDISLVPHYALLDYHVTLGLPKQVTSTTGMDALTHAVEAFIGSSNTRTTAAYAREATQLVFAHLEQAYNRGEDAEARAAMQRASYLAGVAFTRAYVGNVHAISHAISGLYGTAHGLANAVALPIVLDYYLEHGKGERKLGALGGLVGCASARAFVDEIKAMNRRMSIPPVLGRVHEVDKGLDPHDFEFLATQAVAEANPLYPVPMIFDREDFIEILKRLAG